jgi:hypothetical protein
MLNVGRVYILLTILVLGTMEVVDSESTLSINNPKQEDS